MLRKTLFLILLLLLPIHMAYGQNGADKMKIKMIIGDQFLIATLDNTPIAQDFISLLPMTLKMTDYNATEKVSDLPKKLDVSGAPKGYTPHKGDISYYAPWGNLAIYYKDFSYSNGLVKIGEINGNMDLLTQSSSFTIRFEKYEGK